MKKNKWTILFLALSIAFGSISCADSGGNNRAENTQNTQNTGMGFDLSAMEYQPDTDAQPFFLNAWMTRSENGYYFWSPAGTFRAIMFYDKESGQAVPLCNRPDCDHLNTDCNAYYRGVTTPGDGDGYDDNFIQFYEGSLYIIGCDGENYVNLYRLSADGSSREKDTRLFKADFSASDGSASKDYREWHPPTVCIHRGYVYFIDSREKTQKLRRVKLGGSETELVYDAGGTDSLVYRMKPYGEYFFFQIADYTNAEKENPVPEGGLYVYDLTAGEVRLVKKDVIATYEIADQTLYYYFDGSIKSCSLVTAEENLLINDIRCFRFSTDGQYIYAFYYDPGTLETYDKEGTLVGRVEDEHLQEAFYGGDTQYLFANGSLGMGTVESATSMKDLMAGDKSFMGIIDVSSLQEGNGKWEYLFYSKYQYEE